MSEREMIKAWAREECTEELIREYLPMPETERESYWHKYDGKRDIAEYDFNTIPDIKGILEKELQEEFYQDLILPLSVAAFKEKKIIPEDMEKSDGNQGIRSGENEFSIPEFVYVF